jgi:hypothetical protein
LVLLSWLIAMDPSLPCRLHLASLFSFCPALLRRRSRLHHLVACSTPPSSSSPPSRVCRCRSGPLLPWSGGAGDTSTTAWAEMVAATWGRWWRRCGGRRGLRLIAVGASPPQRRCPRPCRWIYSSSHRCRRPRHRCSGKCTSPPLLLGRAHPRCKHLGPGRYVSVINDNH